MNKRIVISNGLAWHARDPSKNLIPSEHQKCSVGVDDAVKLGFVDSQHEFATEYMWVDVEKVGRDGELIGRLANDPMNLHPFILCGELVVFHRRNILAIG